jgi:adenosylhomocysteine nucleosidase
MANWDRLLADPAGGTAPEGDPRPIAVIVAVEEEMRAFGSLVEGRRVLDGTAGRVAGSIGGIPVILLRTGMGTAAAAAKIETAIREFAPRAILSTGFCGVLRDGPGPGDIVIGTEVIDAAAEPGSHAGAWAPHPRLLEAARGIAGNLASVPGIREIHEGRFLTVRSIAAKPAEKRSLGERHGAMAVDMESAGIARAAAAAGVPTLYIRAVVDDVDFEIPLDFGAFLTPDGRLKPLGALASILMKPSVVRALPDLRSRTARASEALARLAEVLIPALGSITEGPEGPGAQPVERLP